MKTRVYPLLFNEQNGLYMPRNPQLHQMAVEFAKSEMGMSDELVAATFTKSARVWVAAEVDENEVPQKITGLSTMRMLADVENLRFKDGKAAKKLIDRMHDWLAEQGVPYGSEVLVRVPTEDDQFLCPQYKDWLAAEKAQPANRVIVRTR